MHDATLPLDSQPSRHRDRVRTVTSLVPALLAFGVAACGAPPPRDCVDGVSCPFGTRCDFSSRMCVSSSLNPGGFEPAPSGPGPTTGGGVGGWLVTIDRTSLNRPLPGSCYVGGVAPTAVAQGPSVVTFEAVTYEGGAPFLAIDPAVAPFTLGDAPLVKMEAAIEGSFQGADWQFLSESQVASLGPRNGMRSALETRTTGATYRVRRSGDRLTGTLELRSAYRCVDRGTTSVERCPSPGEVVASDSASCIVQLPLTAQRLPGMPSWLPPATVPSGATRVGLWLAPLGVVQVPQCYVANQVPQARLTTTGVRDFRVGVLVPNTSLTLSGVVRYDLGDAPVVLINEPLAVTSGRFGLSHVAQSVGPFPRTSRETRTTTASIDATAFQQASMAGRLEVSAQYQCTDSGSQDVQKCPRPPDRVAGDAVSCQQSIAFVAARLP